MSKSLIAMLGVALLLGACSSEQNSAGSASDSSTPSRPSIRPGIQSPNWGMGIGDRVFFEFDKTELRAESRKAIEGWAAWLKRNPQVTMTIEGHADELGTREYNIALGERRAVAARNYLLAQGIDASRVTFISYGKERPAVLGSA